MPVDTRPFPKNVRVIVRNDNRPDESLSFSGHIQLQYDGELLDFPPGKPIIISPEAAYHLFLFDTRSERDNTGRETGKPRNYRDTLSTGTVGQSGIGQQPSLYMQRLMSYGWANDKRKQRWFENFTMHAIEMNNVVDPEKFKAMLKTLPKDMVASVAAD
jgi:hypothetical protein